MDRPLLPALGAIAVVLLTVVPLTPLQSQTDSNSLVGTWRYLGETDRLADGCPLDFMPDSGFAGLLIYTRDGHFSAQILPTGGVAGLTPRLLDLSTSYFGTYTVDWARSVVVHHVTANLVVGPAVPTYQRRFRLEGNRLTLEGDWEYEGKPAVFTVSWERVE